MRDLLAKNWRNAFAEVLASIVGTVGILLAISSILSLQGSGPTPAAVFVGYFSGGQLGLPILASSGIIFIALLRHDRLSGPLSILLYVLLIFPVIATAFIIGINPGFKEKILSDGNLTLLWWIFFWLHLLWLFILIFEPNIPSAQEAGRDEDDRVNKIKPGAIDRG